ncbi:hypothetical protein ADL19_19625 [Streptomyces purpurogeneiscleroticus]|nr:hypothetical protein ADL19_19625 [Streptomyces purpurogeneiscleroticus]
MSEDPHQHIARLIDEAQPIGADDTDEVIDVEATTETGDGGDTPVPRAWGFDVPRMNREWALVLMGSKAVIVHEQSTGPIEDRVRVLTLDAFRAWFLNTRTEYIGPDGKIKAVTWATAWLQSRKRRQYRGIEFKPDPDLVDGAEGYLNLWRGFAVEPEAKVNGYAVLRDHILNNCCGGSAELYAWVFGWFAHIVQRPRERIGTALVMRGKMGTGKTKIGEAIGSLFPSHYFLVDDARYVTGNFNAHMASCLLLQAEEAVWAGDKNAEGRLKSLVTAKTQMIESKGVDPIRLDNFVRLLMTSNEDWVIPAGKDERRFCVLDINPRCAQNHQYFKELDAELDNGGREALLYDLLSYDLSKINLRKIPMTEALLEQKLRSLDSVESWWVQRLYAGNTLRGQEYWQAEVPCEMLFEDYIQTSERIGIKRKAEEIAFGLKMRKLVPEISRAKRYHEDTARRRWCYIMPDLADCREAFASEVGQDIGFSDVDA